MEGRATGNEIQVYGAKHPVCLYCFRWPYNEIKAIFNTTSNGLTTCIIDWINCSGGTANRINTQGQVRKERVEFAGNQHRDFIRFTPSTTRKGTADIHAVMQGRHLSIEVKIDVDKLSPEQLKEQERITKAGGLYFVARDMQSFVTWFNNKFEQ